MREGLWPSSQERHARHIEEYFPGKLHEPVEVLIAFDDAGSALGFIELSIRNHAEGCLTDHVAYVEGWYVVPNAKGKGLGAALLGAAEA